MHKEKEELELIAEDAEPEQLLAADEQPAADPGGGELSKEKSSNPSSPDDGSRPSVCSLFRERVAEILSNFKRSAIEYFSSENFKIAATFLVIVLFGGGLSVAISNYFNAPRQVRTIELSVLGCGSVLAWTGTPDVAYSMTMLQEVTKDKSAKEMPGAASKIVESFVRETGVRDDRAVSASLLAMRYALWGYKPAVSLQVSKDLAQKYPKSSFVGLMNSMALAANYRLDLAEKEIDRASEVAKSHRAGFVSLDSFKTYFLVGRGKWLEVVDGADTSPAQESVYFKAVGLVQLGRWQEARRVCLENPKYARFTYLAGRAASLEGDSKFAQKCATELRSNSRLQGASQYFANLLLCDIAVDRGDFLEAMRFLKAAQSKEKEVSNSSKLMEVHLLNQLGRGKEASVVLSSLEQGGSTFMVVGCAEHCAVQAETLFLSGSYSSALDKAKQAMGIKPSLRLSYEIAAKASEKLGKQEECKRYVDRLKTLTFERAFLCGV